MKKTLAAILVVVTLGCSGEGYNADPGVVVEEQCTMSNESSGCSKYWLTVEDVHGKQDKFVVLESTADKCRVGDDWPACKDM